MCAGEGSPSGELARRRFNVLKSILSNHTQKVELFVGAPRAKHRHHRGYWLTMKPPYANLGGMVPSTGRQRLVLSTSVSWFIVVCVVFGSQKYLETA